MVSFYRGGIGLLFVLVWLALRPRGSGFASRQLWFWSVIAGVGVAGNFTYYFISIAHGSVAVAATLMYCAPVFVYLVSFLLKLEQSTPLKWVAIALVILGVVLLTGFYEIDAGDVTLTAAGAGLLSALSYAVFLFGFKYAAPHGSPPAILVIAFIVLATILIWLGVASIVAMVEPVTASLFSVVVLYESLAILQIVGMCVILIAVTALSIYSSGHTKSCPSGVVSKYRLYQDSGKR